MLKAFHFGKLFIVISLLTTSAYCLSLLLIGRVFTCMSERFVRRFVYSDCRISGCERFPTLNREVGIRMGA